MPGKADPEASASPRGDATLAAILSEDSRSQLMMILLAKLLGRLRCSLPRRICIGSTTLFHNTHLSMSLKGIGFADRNAIPRGVSGFVGRVRQVAWLPVC